MTGSLGAHELVLWDRQSGKSRVLREPKTNPDVINSKSIAWKESLGAEAVAFDGTGKILAAAAPDGVIRLYKTSTWEEFAALGEPRMGHGGPIAFTPDSQFLIWTGAGREPFLSKGGVVWDVFQQKMESMLVASPDSGVRSNMAVGPNGQFLVCARGRGTESDIRVYLLPGGLCCSSDDGRICAGDSDAVAVSPDGKTVAAAGRPGRAGHEKDPAEIHLCDVTVSRR